MSGIVMALTNATVVHDGVAVNIRKGEAWDAAAPVVAAHRDLFTTDPARARGAVRKAADRPVEQATRAPGEKSRARRA